MIVSILASHNSDENRVGVVYFRAGYTPRDFTSDKHWDALLQLERSSAIKCPSVAYHLAGTKKVQQALAVKGVLEKFVDEKTAAKLQSCFAGLWGLEKDDAETKAIIAKAIATPDDYVLKPQREGGGNNLWGKQISDVSSSLSLASDRVYVIDHLTFVVRLISSYSYYQKQLLKNEVRIY
jgi:glutathione synthetase